MPDGDLIPVLEGEFGVIETGMRSTGSESVQLVSYTPQVGLPRFVSTLGLSNVAEPPSEWFMEFAPELSANQAASVLDHVVSLHLAGRLSAPSRGSYLVFPSEGDRVWPGDDSRGLYFTIPVFRSSQFQDQMRALGVIPIWVLPITQSEVDILDTQGWRQLEDHWDTHGSDLHSPFRS